MRFNIPLFFVKEATKQYDPDSGLWIAGESIRTKKYGNMTHMSAERQRAVFGDVKSDRYIIRLQRAYTKAYDYIEVGRNRYIVDVERCPHSKQSLMVTKEMTKSGGD